MSKLSLTRVVKPLLVSLNCPRALTVWLMLHHNEHDQLVSLTCDPSEYADMEQFQSAYRATGLLAKYPKLSVSVSPEKVAMDAFRDAETTCRTTNENLISARRGQMAFSAASQWVIHEARKKIETILGWDPLGSTWRQKQFDDSFSWGPGSTSAVGGPGVSLADKLLAQPECTASLNYLVPANYLLARIPSWYFEHVCARPDGPTHAPTGVKCTIVHGNKVTFVPKNAKTHRSIAVEPHLNVLAQKACGGLIRALLKRHGLNLDCNQRNIELAQIGSKTGQYATLDLKAASDTISKEVVRELLPPRWFELLNACRSHRYKDPETGAWSYYHKFSSMGNGFTFELESLIFWALANSTCDYLGIEADTAVFGDDIVCPSGASPVLTEVLQACGFTLNSSKSFTQGPFRESCGGDFYLGTPVTRFQMKEEISDRELVVVHNKATTASLLPHGRDRVFRSFLYAIRSTLSERGAGYALGPYGIDGCLWADFDEAAPPFSRKHWKRYHRAYWRIRRETFVPRNACATSILDVTARLWGYDKTLQPFNPFSAPISVSSTVGRPQRGKGKWVFRDICVADFPFIGGFI